MFPSPREMVAEIGNSDSTAEALALFGQYRTYIEGTQFIFASNGGNAPGMTVNRNFSHTGVVRGLFNSEKILVLDDRSFDNMYWGGGETVYGFDQSIALDTMTLIYIAPYIEGNTAKVPKDFMEVFNFIAQDDVNVDPMPYMHENVPNLVNEKYREKIKIKLRGYEVLRTLDKNELATNGEVRSTVTEKELDVRAKALFTKMIRKSKDKGYTAMMQYRHRMMSCLLFKMVEIQLRYQSAKSVSDKLFEFFEFQHDHLSTIFARESVIAKAYFENGTDLAFFGKMQRKNDDFFRSLRGMAWDLLHIRHMEENLLLRQKKGSADYHFPAFLTFDEKYIKLIDLHPLKACAIFGPRREVMPFYNGNLQEMLTKDMPDPVAFTDRFFSREAAEKRTKRRVHDYRVPRKIKRELGAKLASIVQVPYSELKTSIG